MPNELYQDTGNPFYDKDGNYIGGGGNTSGQKTPQGDPLNWWESMRRDNQSSVRPWGDKYLDPYSTGVSPDAPQGGLYGMYNALAGGQMSDSEGYLQDLYAAMAGGQMTEGEGSLQDYLQNAVTGGADGQDVALWQLANEFRTQADPYSDAAKAGLDQAGQVKNYESDLYGQMIRGSQDASDPEAAQLAGYKGMLGQGYSPDELAAIQQAGMDSTRAGLETSKDAMLRAQRRTGNTAGMYGAMADLSTGGANALAKQARDTQILQAQERARRTETGLQGLGQNAGIGQSRIASNQGQAAGMAESVGNRQLQAANAYQGLSGLANQRQGQTLGQMQGTQNAWRQGNQGYASLLQNQQNALRQGQIAGTTGLANQNQGLRQGQQAGLGGLQSLYDSSAAQNNAFYETLANLFKTPRGTYTKAADIGK